MGYVEDEENSTRQELVFVKRNKNTPMLPLLILWLIHIHV